MDLFGHTGVKQPPSPGLPSASAQRQAIREAQRGFWPPANKMELAHPFPEPYLPLAYWRMLDLSPPDGQDWATYLAMLDAHLVDPDPNVPVEEMLDYRYTPPISGTVDATSGRLMSPPYDSGRLIGYTLLLGCPDIAIDLDLSGEVIRIDGMSVEEYADMVGFNPPSRQALTLPTA